MNQLYDHSYGVVPVYLGDSEPLFLLMKQHNGFWSFPKGHPETGETGQETALREFNEEAGISECTLLDLPPISIHYSFNRGDDVHNKTVTLFGATVPSQEVAMQANEIQEYAWLPYEEARTRFHYSSNIEALDTVKNYLSALNKRAN